MSFKAATMQFSDDELEETVPSPTPLKPQRMLSYDECRRPSVQEMLFNMVTSKDSK